MTSRSRLNGWQRPGDREIRAALLQQLAAMEVQHPRRLLQEFWIPVSHERADVVDVNGRLIAFEIKSARDNLSRLNRQVAAFSRVFDQVSLVCDGRHLTAAEAVIPAWWGLVEVRGMPEAIALCKLREAGLNDSPDRATRLQLLWKSELAAALRRFGVRARGMDREQMRHLLTRHVAACDLDTIVRSALVQRQADARRW